MRSCLSTEIRRCQPLLGTFVEITVCGKDEGELNRAVDLAFAAIGRIHGLMSVHTSDSEVGRLNRAAHRHPVTVSRETFGVLRRADRLARESGGAFDHTVAPTLARWGYEPVTLRHREPQGYRFIEFLPGRRVRFLRPLAIDLGGIAKGFAVDVASMVLRQHRVAAAIVNAGGDLRVFGRQPATFHLRHPGEPQTVCHTLRLGCAALATSSPCFTEKDWRARRVSHLARPQDDSAVTGAISVTVRADECWLADALTKVVLNAPEVADRLLERHHARAIVITA